MKNDQIGIRIVRGGFIIAYAENDEWVEEIVPTQRKLLQRLKELIEMASLVPAE